MRGASPLAVHNFMKIVEVFDIGRLHLIILLDVFVLVPFESLTQLSLSIFMSALNESILSSD